MENNEYIYKDNEKTFMEVMIGWVRGIIETILPFTKYGPFPELLDRLFASRFAKLFLASYAMIGMM
ncbi:MAG: hypothetical protein GX241_00550 [Ruminococcaceae bacterium]|nr:hypothetical protein [Oscillospiraceae bacterium]